MPRIQRDASTPKLSGNPVKTNPNPFDGRVTFTGFHGRLSFAKPDSLANVLLSQRPPFSAQATNVKHHANGVTSYDITKVGPPFAYKPVGASTFEVNGKRYAIVEVKIGPDKATGSKSVYEGRVYEIFGEGPDGAWAAELWDDVKATNAFTDAAANLHNQIVDGSVGKGGFRGLAGRAHELEKKGQVPARSSTGVPPLQVSDALVAFVADRKAIPGLTPGQRTGLMKALREAQGK